MCFSWLHTPLWSISQSFPEAIMGKETQWTTISSSHLRPQMSRCNTWKSCLYFSTTLINSNNKKQWNLLSYYMEKQLACNGVYTSILCFWEERDTVCSTKKRNKKLVLKSTSELILHWHWNKGMWKISLF